MAEHFVICEPVVLKPSPLNNHNHHVPLHAIKPTGVMLAHNCCVNREALNPTEHPCLVFRKLSFLVSLDEARLSLGGGTIAG